MNITERMDSIKQFDGIALQPQYIGELLHDTVVDQN